MALINCPQCGNKISDKAGSCPKCGYNFKNEIAYEDVLTGTEKRSWYLFKISMVGYLLSIILQVIGGLNYEVFEAGIAISNFSKIFLFMSLCLIAKNGLAKGVLWLIWLFCSLDVILPYMITLGDTTLLTITSRVLTLAFILYFVAKCKSTVRTTMVLLLVSYISWDLFYFFKIYLLQNYGIYQLQVIGNVLGLLSMLLKLIMSIMGITMSLSKWGKSIIREPREEELVLA